MKRTQMPPTRILTPETLKANKYRPCILVAVCLQLPIPKAMLAGFSGTEGGREQDNKLIVFNTDKNLLLRPVHPTQQWDGKERQYFMLPDPRSPSIISSPVPPHASEEDPRRFIGGCSWITSPQGNFPPNTHMSEVDLCPTYNRLYSSETTPCLQPRYHC